MTDLDPQADASSASPMSTDSNSCSADQHKIKFNGSASEYFKIWIVNVGLTIITLGIYSAWAKVRTRKYLYGNTELAGARFDYHADPIKILKGRILVAAIFIGYSLGGKISPFIAVLFLLLFWSLFPWILVRALIFNLTNSSYRNVRFGFDKDYKGSYAAYIKGALVSIFTLGLATPYALKLHTCFKFNRIRFGTQKTSFDAPTSYFFKICYMMFAFIFVGVMMAVMIVASSIGLGASTVGAATGLATVVSVVCIYGSMFLGTAYLRSRLINLTANQTTLGPVRFHSDLLAKDLAFLYVTNLLGCALTLGLAIPWAVVRTLRYRLERMTVIADEATLTSFTAESLSGNQNATADAAADFWDIDLGL